MTEQKTALDVLDKQLEEVMAHRAKLQPELKAHKARTAELREQIDKGEQQLKADHEAYTKLVGQLREASAVLEAVKGIEESEGKAAEATRMAAELTLKTATEKLSQHALAADLSLPDTIEKYKLGYLHARRDMKVAREQLGRLKIRANQLKADKRAYTVHMKTEQGKAQAEKINQLQLAMAAAGLDDAFVILPYKYAKMMVERDAP
ncbi:Hypothetical protein POVN_LOCUS513 [uncultured virus]|nr:Hypothetical protein POVN_LOCUS513 [uncultured virus]